MIKAVRDSEKLIGRVDYSLNETEKNSVVLQEVCMYQKI